MFEMMKQMNQLRKLQKEMAAKSFEAKTNDGLIVVVAGGDMAIKSIQIDAKAIDITRPDRLAKTLTSTVNSALDSAKKGAAADMAKMTGGLGGLANMLKG
jgi:nucleoid-associated protein EbfC